MNPEPLTTTSSDPDAWLADLDASIDAFIGDAGRSPDTIRYFKKRWKHWQDHCTDLGCDPYDAPWAAWQELLHRRRLDGRFYNSPHRLEGVLASVVWHYAQSGLDTVPEPRKPTRSADWAALCRSFRLDLIDARAAGDVEEIMRSPMMRDDVRRILSVPAEAMPLAVRRGQAPDVAESIAAMLVALDGHLSAAELCTTKLADFKPHDDGSIALGTLLFPCDHQERSRGVPWDCTACAVRRVLNSTPDHQRPLLQTSRSTAVMRIRSAARRWPGLDPQLDASPKNPARLIPRGDLTDYELAGLRRGLVVVNAINPKDAAWLLGRAWIGISWQAGFRMVSDLVRLPRKAVKRLPHDEGFVIRLGGTKDDPEAAKKVSRPFTFADSGQTAQALAEYLAVRDAAVGTDPEGPLFSSTPAGVFGPNWLNGMTKPVQVANSMIKKLCDAAGIEAPMTSYSARIGYATQSDADGRGLEQTRKGMRHAKADTTIRYTRSTSKKTATKLANALTKKEEER